MSLDKECVVCEGTSYENIDGLYYCVICGTKSEAAADIENIVEDDAFTSTREIRQAQRVVKSQEDKVYIEEKFSTFEVYSHVLKRQSEDLIKLGAPVELKEVVVRLWAKYLNKLGICFLNSKKAKINKKSLKWRRDQEYFMMYNLNVQFEKGQEKSEGTSSAMMIAENIKVETDVKMEEYNEGDSESSLFYESDEEKNYENTGDDYDDLQIESGFQNSKFIDEFEYVRYIFKGFTKFEWIRMAHTIVLIHLALLATKSPILISDLVRFIHEGRVSYFNIDEILPKSMKFTYADDSRMFNKMFLPSTDFLRCLTFKLANFLDLDKIEFIDIGKITTRFIIDLNLPNQLLSIVNMLLMKIPPIREFNFKIDRFRNLEAMALSYIFAAIFVVFIYDVEDETPSHGNSFIINEWIKQVQRCFFKVKRYTSEPDRVFQDPEFEAYELRKLMMKKHRLVEPKDIKSYSYKCRRPEIKKALKEPLNLFIADKIYQKEDSFSQKTGENPILYLRNLTAKDTSDWKNTTINNYLNEEKFKLLETAEFKSEKFNNFVKIVLEDSKLRGEYLLGYRIDNLDWILELFHEIAQTKSFNIMYFYARSLVNKLKF